MCHLEDDNCNEQDLEEYMKDRSEELRQSLIFHLDKMRERWRQTMAVVPTNYADGTINGLRLAIDIVHSLTLPHSSKSFSVSIKVEGPPEGPTIVNMGGD